MRKKMGRTESTLKKGANMCHYRKYEILWRSKEEVICKEGSAEFKHI